MIDNVTVLITPNKFFDASARMRRINKTTQVITGFWEIKEPFTDEIDCTIYLSSMDHGIWKRLFQRSFTKLCSMVVSGGLFHPSFHKYFPNLPSKCPFAPGNYTYGPIAFHRYRKDWDTDLKFLIPPLIPEANKWRVDVHYYKNGKSNDILQIGRVDVRIFNKFSAIQ